MKPRDFAVEIPRRLVELLTLTLIEVSPEYVSVGSVNLRINVENRLDIVVTRLEVMETRERSTKRARIHDRSLARFQPRDIDGNDFGRIEPQALQPRLWIATVADQHKQSARDGAPMDGGWKGDFETRSSGLISRYRGKARRCTEEPENAHQRECGVLQISEVSPRFGLSEHTSHGAVGPAAKFSA